MKYDPEAVRAVLAGYPKITGRPTQKTLWGLKLHLINGLRKISHPVHKHEGYAPYIRTPDEQALVQNDPWTVPRDPGSHFIPSNQALSAARVEAEKSTFDFAKQVADTFDAVKFVLVQIFEDAIDDTYHAGATGMGQRGFGHLKPDEILAKLLELYGHPTLEELDAALLRLHDPMDRTEPVEVMLRTIEEVQMFLLADRAEDRGLKQAQLISYALIKLSKTGLYGKAIEKWNARQLKDRKLWADFRAFMIEQYERMLREAGGSTMAQDGFTSAFHAQEEDEESMKTAAEYHELNSTMERNKAAQQGEIDELRAALAAVMMSGPPNPGIQPPSLVYAPPQAPPQAAYFGQAQQMPYQQQTKKRKTPRDSPGQVNWGQNGVSPNMAPPQQQQQQFQAQQQQPRGALNPRKRWNNLYYCYTCGYDVDHPGSRCPNPKYGHQPHASRKTAHTIPGACMKAQHKALPDGTGQGEGWLMAQATNKGFYTMAARGQQPWATVFGMPSGSGGNGGHGNGGRGGGRGRGNGNGRSGGDRRGNNGYGGGNWRNGGPNVGTGNGGGDNNNGGGGNNGGLVNWGAYSNQGGWGT